MLCVVRKNVWVLIVESCHHKLKSKLGFCAQKEALFLPVRQSLKWWSTASLEDCTTHSFRGCLCSAHNGPRYRGALGLETFHISWFTEMISSIFRSAVYLFRTGDRMNSGAENQTGNCTIWMGSMWRAYLYGVKYGGFVEFIFFTFG